MDPRIRFAMEFMKENLDKQLTLADLAEKVNLSPSRFSHLFKLETGDSPARHLKKLKIEKAGELLETTFLSINEVMKQVGLCDKSHFLRDFKKTYGVAPSIHRSRCFNRDDHTRQPCYAD
ncbi:MAG: helix-turn-helix domain-containing protein [Blastocatellia bacterium]|nr:helix-turn-helix domain-containing protein [Blastocatellia bacterium]